MNNSGAVPEESDNSWEIFQTIHYFPNNSEPTFDRKSRSVLVDAHTDMRQKRGGSYMHDIAFFSQDKHQHAGTY